MVGIEPTIVGIEWGQECEAAGHFESTVWRQRAVRKWGCAKGHQLCLKDLLPPLRLSQAPPPVGDQMF